MTVKLMLELITISSVYGPSETILVILHTLTWKAHETPFQFQLPGKEIILAIYHHFSLKQKYNKLVRVGYEQFVFIYSKDNTLSVLFWAFVFPICQ